MRCGVIVACVFILAGALAPRAAQAARESGVHGKRSGCMGGESVTDPKNIIGFYVRFVISNA